MALHNQNRPGRVILSERLRNMRFMREREETDVRAKLEEEQREREKAAHWTLETDQANEEHDRTPLVIVEDTFTSPSSSSAYSGRQSFGKFNVVVEKRNRTGKSEPKMELEEAKPADNRPVPIAPPSRDGPNSPIGFKPPLAKGSSNLSKMNFRTLASGKRSFKPSPGAARKRTKYQNSPRKR